MGDHGQKGGKPVNSALLADDVPNAKRKVLWLIAGEAAATVLVLALVFASARLQWHLAIRLGLIALWVLNDVIAWQLWKSWAYRLTVTEKEVAVNLFFRQKRMPLSEITSFRCTPLDGKFYTFLLEGNGRTLEICTQYREELLTILQTRTTAQNASEPETAEN